MWARASDSGSSRLTEHILWEIGMAAKVCGAQRMIFIAREDTKTSWPGSAVTIRHAIGRDVDAVLAML